MINTILVAFAGTSRTDYMSDSYRELAKQRYKEHYEHVRRFVPKERLLEFKNEDGWEPLCKFLPLKVTRLPEASTDSSALGLPHGACVISENKNVGFGSSGTQEETHVGSSPEACPAVLMTPTLEDTQVLIVVGAEAMISMKGYGREARLDKVLAPKYNDTNPALSVWPRRTMLYMDALELDMFDTEGQVPDLLPEHVEREIRKAYAAFNSKPSRNEGYTDIVTRLWGCGAFGGDWQIKTIIQ